MNFNSFQKNGLLKINNNLTTHSKLNNGPRSIEQIKNDMLNAKNHNNDKETKTNNEKLNNNITNYRERINKMQDFNRWR